MAAGASTQSRRKANKKVDMDKNPYSSLGRDKFSALLAEIEEKKRTILSQIGPEDVSLIRFISYDDNKLKPVVVKANNDNNSRGKSNKEGVRRVKDEEQAPAAEGEAEGSKVRHLSHHQASKDERQKAPEIEVDRKDGKKMKISNLASEVKFPRLQINQPISCSLKEVKLPRLQIQPNHVYVGVIVVMVLLFLALFERYWKIYYELQFQTRICQKMGTE